MVKFSDFELTIGYSYPPMIDQVNERLRTSCIEIDRIISIETVRENLDPRSVRVRVWYRADDGN